MGYDIIDRLQDQLSESNAENEGLNETIEEQSDTIYDLNTEVNYYKAKFEEVSDERDKLYNTLEGIRALVEEVGF